MIGCVAGAARVIRAIRVTLVTGLIGSKFIRVIRAIRVIVEIPYPDGVIEGAGHEVCGVILIRE